jgi:hypothetical protein
MCGRAVRNCPVRDFFFVERVSIISYGEQSGKDLIVL